MAAVRILFIAPRGARFPGGDLAALDFEVLGPHPADAAGELLTTERPDAVLLDVDGDPAAFDVVLQLHEALEPCRAVVIGSHLSLDVMREAFLVGVYACLSRSVSASVIRSALHRAAEGTAVMRRCLEAAERPARADPKAEIDRSSLTPREFEILQLLLDGSTTATMARALRVTPRTVKFHVANLLRKLGFDSRLALLAKLRRDDTFAPFEAR